MQNLLFFNKEGYPYNFTYDEITESFNGKLIFDPNGSDTYRTLILNVFERVAPLQVSGRFQLNNIELFTPSGYTLTTGSKENYIIKDIRPVNDGPYYSKWIIGDNFNKLFPLGSYLHFSGLTNTNFSNPTFLSDFQDDYYLVLANKPNAVLIMTNTKNENYNTTYLSGDTATISNQNYFTYNDYTNTFGNPGQFGGLYFYTGQTISLIDEEDNVNNNVYTLASKGTARFPYQEFELPTGQTGNQLRVELELLTERPKVYTGPIIAGITGTTAEIYFERGLTNSLNGGFIDLTVGSQIIFEDYNDQTLFGNKIFTIQNIITEQYLNSTGLTFYRKYNKAQTKLNNFNAKRQFPVDFTGEEPPTILPKKYIAYDYYVELSNQINLNLNDEFFLSGGTGKNNNRLFKIVDISDNGSTKTCKLEQYVLPEENEVYDLYLKLPTYDIKTLICNTTASGSYTGNAVCYFTTNTFNLTQTILDDYYVDTIEAFNNNYRTELNQYGIDTYSLASVFSGQTGLTDNFIVEGYYDDVNYYNVNVYIDNTNDSTYITGSTSTSLPRFYLHFNEEIPKNRKIVRYSDQVSKNFYREIEFDLSNNASDYGFSLRLNGTEFFAEFSGDTETTLAYFVNKEIYEDEVRDIQSNKDLFFVKGFNLINSGNSLIIAGLFPNVKVWDLEIQVNLYSSYEVKEEQDSQGLFLASADLTTTQYNLLEEGFATGMIIDITGSTFYNNREYVLIALTENRMSLSYQGHFEPVNIYSFNSAFNSSFDIEGDIGTLSLFSREFLRRPRESATKDIWYKFRWDLVGEQQELDETIFYYDFSGEQENLLYGPPDENGNHISTLAYQGPKPLYNTDDPNELYLNKYPNMNTTHINNPQKQQTIFEKLKFKLEQLDDLDTTYVPEPIQVFIGYKSPQEGVNRKKLVLEKIENLVFSGTTHNIENNNNTQFTMDNDGKITFHTPQKNNFLDLGFEKGQIIQLKFTDLAETGQTIFPNYENYSIDSVSPYSLSIDLNLIENEFLIFNTSASTAGFNYSITVQPKTLLECPLYGQTEIEDERFAVNLQNLGIEIEPKTERIFPSSDLSDDGINLILLNQKRKEMLALYPEIFNYIGAYKSLINAINFFGYNDLELYEYYRNINVDSPLYHKLKRIKIPDIFDNTEPGYTKEDPVKNSIDRTSFKKTNLLNLTYPITDEEGNYVLLYSLEEAQTKLQELKKWLIRNLLPLNTNIIDITGVADTLGSAQLKNDVSNQVQKSTLTQASTNIDFVIKETQNFGQNYIVTVDWYSIMENFDPKSVWSAKIKTYSNVNGELEVQQYFDLYKTDFDSFTFTYNRDVDPYLSIETKYVNNSGVGLTKNILRNMRIARNYYLINHNLYIYARGLEYLHLNDGYYYFFDEQSRMFVSENEINFQYSS